MKSNKNLFGSTRFHTLSQIKIVLLGLVSIKLQMIKFQKVKKCNSTWKAFHVELHFLKGWVGQPLCHQMSHGEKRSKKVSRTIWMAPYILSCLNKKITIYGHLYTILQYKMVKMCDLLFECGSTLIKLLFRFKL